MAGFRSLKFSLKLILLAGAPALLVLVLSLGYLIDVRDDLASAERLESDIDLAITLGNLAHQHAVERGLSAGFLGSNGTQGGAKLQTQRRLADEVATLFVQEWSAAPERTRTSLKGQVDELNRLLDQKSQIRQKVDSLARPNPAFTYYSDLNMAALDAVETLAMKIPEIDIAAQFASYRYFLWAVEKAGQVRGKLNGAIKLGELKPYAHSEIRDYLRTQDNYVAKALRHATPYVQAEIKALQGGDNYQAIASVSRLLMQDGAQITQLDAAHRDNWFELATRHIDALKSSANTMAQTVQGGVSAKITALSSNLMLAGLALAAVLILLGVFVAWQVRDLNARVQALRTVLSRVSAQGDLTLRVDAKVDDELGHIAQAVNQFLNHFEILVRSIQTTCNRLQSSSRNMSEVTAVNRTAIDAQLEQTHLVASAITEMSASFAEVARSTASAEASSRAAQTSSSQGQRNVDQTSQAVTHLAEEIDRTEATIAQVATHCQQIGGILDTIRGIAEQTNLLALNAAIEAARAGEQGRGFAVVADEVRSLAQRTQTSTEEINNMITTLQRSADDAQNTMRSSRDTANSCRSFAISSGQAMADVHTNIDSLHEMTCQIAAATEQQSAVAETVTQNVVAISGMADSILHTAKSLEEGGQDLKQMAAELDATVERYRVS